MSTRTVEESFQDKQVKLERSRLLVNWLLQSDSSVQRNFTF